MSSKRRILVTSGLPYANGSIHIGHLVEYLQTDIWARVQRLMGHECVYMCGDDTHGTPTMLSARAQGITPDELVARMHAEHARDFAGFHVRFDNYYTTNSPENREFCETIYGRLREGGHIVTRSIEQAWCPKDELFLPDRMIRGTCPRCGAADQYGDSCEACSSTYSPTDLKDARCSICGTAPLTRASEHYFVRLSDFQERLQQWVEKALDQDQMKRKLIEWFDEGLKDWDISRDAPYFGFKIPGTEDKYFYVWLDAPVGYMAATRNWCDRTGRKLEDYWLSPEAEIIHFIGKDIMYFHTLFWPAMLMGGGFKAPNKVFMHGFLTVNGQKMSKSRGTFITARRYLEHLDPEYLRYYYACKLSSRVEDIDLNLADFSQRVNSDVGNQFVNLGSRVISFLHKRLEGRLGEIDPGEGEALLKAIEEGAGTIVRLYDEREFGKAMKEIMNLAHAANQYVANAAPWSLAGAEPEKARSILTTGLNAFAKLSILLSPVLPVMSGKVDKLLGRETPGMQGVYDRLTNRPVNPFEPLFVKVDSEAVQRMVEGQAEAKPVFSYEVPPLADQIDFETFGKVDLRVAKVLAAESVEKAEKLLKLTVDLGPLGRRNIFAGIKKTHAPEKLVGRTIVLAANLAPRKMKFGISEGMLLAANAGEAIYLVTLEDGARPGQKLS
jgi:methionyl-tRNA synthetase